MSRTSIPSFQKAVVQDEGGNPKFVNRQPLPQLMEGTVLVKTTAVALNPSDHKMGVNFPTPGAVIGMDFAGAVVAIHRNTKTDLRVGELVFGAVHGSNPGDPSNGAFAEVVRARPELLLRVPPALPSEQAASLPVGLITSLLSLWDPSALALTGTPDQPIITEKPIPVLVYGGSTATGTLAIQLLRLSGYDPIATCSPRNFDLVRSYGASAVFDYVRPSVADDIKKHTNGTLEYAYDCIADPDSVAHCYSALRRVGGRYVSLELVPENLRTRRAVHAEFVLAYEAFGEAVKLSKGYERSANKEKLRFAADWIRVFQRLLEQGALKPHPTKKLEGGLEAIVQGLAMLKSGSVSGEKLVVLV